MKAVAARQAEAADESADTLTNKAREKALQALRDHGTPERLAAALALAVSRRRILEALPTSLDTTSASVTVSFLSPYPELLARIGALLDAEDLDGLIQLVPIRGK